MNDTEQLPIETELRPSPGIPVSILRGQVEAASTLQAAIMDAATSGQGESAANFSLALSNVIEGVSELSASPLPEGVREIVREELQGLAREGATR
jgi:hypothetical protein